MKPGDLIEWRYQYSKQRIDTNEMLWSSIMQKWIPMGIVSTFLHQDNEIYFWINSKGCFSAHVNDITVSGSVHNNKFNEFKCFLWAYGRQ